LVITLPFETTSAVPVLADTAPFAARTCAVPPVTVVRSIARNALAVAGGNAAVAGPAGSLPGTSTGFNAVPFLTAPATIAIWSGLAVTVPWPIIEAASATSSFGAGTSPPYAGIDSFRSWPKPNIAAAFVIPSAGSRPCWEMKAVLQDWLSAFSMVPAPYAASPS
jgi:hypothetical protein